MISLEQIRTLESKVHKAVNMLTAAQEENQLLRGKLSAYESRIEELEYLIEEFKEDQSEIEEGIISALSHLDQLENAVGGLKHQTQPPVAEAEVIEPEAEAASIESDEIETPENAEWEVPAQQFKQPEAVEIDTIDDEEPAEQAEVEAEPVRNQQLDIF